MQEQYTIRNMSILKKLYRLLILVTHDHNLGRDIHHLFRKTKISKTFFEYIRELNSGFDKEDSKSVIHILI